MVLTIDKWCIRRNEENYEMINEWFNFNCKPCTFSAKSDFHKPYNNNPSYWSYLHYPSVNEKYLFSYVKSGYVEITFDEFLKYIITDNSGFLNRQKKKNTVYRKTK